MADPARAARAQRARNDGGNFIGEPTPGFARQAVVADLEAGRIARPLNDAGAVTSHTKRFRPRFHCLPDAPIGTVHVKFITLFAPIAVYAIEAFSDV